MSKLKLNLLFLLFFGILAAQALKAQSFSASVNSTTVGLNEPFQISFQFNGDDINSIRNFKAPDFKGFRVLSGPNQSQSIQIINGSMSASLSFSYYIQATNLGNSTIGSASLDYKGKNYKTRPIKLSVVKGSAPQNNNNGRQGSGGGSEKAVASNISENVFIRAIADKQKVMKGEQVTVTYKLYTRYDISSPQISKLPTYQGFWAEELDGANRINFTTEVVNGKQFHVGVLKRAALFPTQTGELSVTPFELKIPVVVPKQRRRGGGDIFDEFFNDPFFNQGETVEYNAKSNTIKVSVLPLPSGNVPSSFSGAVGEYNFYASLDKSTVKANEPVTLKVSISGTGNVNLIDQPQIKLPSGFEKYDPKINTQVNRSGGAVTGQKTFEVLMVPRVQGQTKIEPVEFTFYNPKAKRYVTLRSPEFSLNVEKGDGSSQGVASGFNKEDVKLLGEDIRFIKTSTDDLYRQGGYTLFSFWFWTISILPLFALIGAVIRKRNNDRLSGNLELMKYQRAEKMAKNRLKSAKKSLEANSQKDFYSDISLALIGYLEDKLHIPKSQFTIDHALEVLKKNNVTPELIDEVKNSVEKCEYARFAPAADGSSAMQGMFDQAVKIIVEIEKGKIKG